MPFASLPPICRRSFMLSSVAAGVTLLRAESPELHWALLSDTHVSGDLATTNRGFNPAENLRAAIAAAQEAKVEGSLICGDIAFLEGLSPDYQAVQQMLKPLTARMPVVLALGNHDDRTNFNGVFGAQPGAQKVPDRDVLVVETAAVRLIVLDSLMAPNTIPGLLGKAQRSWLAEYLASSDDKPTIIVVHHTLNDEDTALLDAPRLFEILRPSRKVKAILYGHSHRYQYSNVDGIHLINLPALGYNFADSEPVGWVEARITPEGASFTLHAMGGNRARDGKPVAVVWRT